MTELYYECIKHGNQHVEKINTKVIQQTLTLGFIETVYELKCGCNVVNQLRTKIDVVYRS